jgi:hypothetical protein
MADGPRRFFSAEQILEAGLEGQWLKLSAEEEKAVIGSIAGENMIRNAAMNNFGGADAPGYNLRYYRDRGYVVIHGFGKEAEKHPLDEAAKAPEPQIEKGSAPFVRL